MKKVTFSNIFIKDIEKYEFPQSHSISSQQNSFEKGTVKITRKSEIEISEPVSATP